MKFGLENDANILKMKKGAFIYKFEPSTRTVFVGTEAGGKIKSFYVWDGRATDQVVNAFKTKGLF